MNDTSAVFLCQINRPFYHGKQIDLFPMIHIKCLPHEALHPSSREVHRELFYHGNPRCGAICG